ncbi:hypothetical protein P7C70_g8939, partial [Phenoliferia sp. Uapishka_3]
MASVIKLVPGRTAFFVCDIQERFRTAIFAYPSVIATAEKMVKGAALLGVPVVVTEQNPKGRFSCFHSYFNELEESRSNICVQSALGATVPLPLADLAPGLHPDWSPLAKTKFSMVLPEVEKSLKEWKTESVVIFGIESHVCVLQTALDLLERNISVHILADGVSSCNHDEVPVALAVRPPVIDSNASFLTSGGFIATSSLWSSNNDQRIRTISAHGSAFPLRTRTMSFRADTLIKGTKDETKEALKNLVAGKL